MTPIEKFTYHPDPEVNRLTIKLLQQLKCQENVLGIFLSGSTIKGGQDRYSDVDINVVARNKATFKSKLHTIIQETSPLLFRFEPDFVLPDLCVFYLQAGQKLDFLIYGPEDPLDHSFSQQAVILQDAGRLLAAKRKGWSQQMIQKGLKEKYLTMALANLWALRREAYRRNLFEARYNLDDARWCIASYVNLRRNYRYFGFDHFHNHLNPSAVYEMHHSLKNNASFPGIIKAGLCLLTVIAGFGYFEDEVIKATRYELQKVLSQLAAQPTYLKDMIQEGG